MTMDKASCGTHREWNGKDKSRGGNRKGEERRKHVKGEESHRKLELGRLVWRREAIEIELKRPS